MAIAHPGYEKIYTTDDYSTRSNSLKNNYYVRNGKGDEWASKYVERIQKHLDARKESFSVDADNQSFPPSICGIQNGIVAFEMNLCEWRMTDTKADLTANSIVAMESGYKWILRFDFYATWKELASYTIRYHGSDVAPGDARTTRVVVGTPIATRRRRRWASPAGQWRSRAGRATATATTRGSSSTPRATEGGRSWTAGRCPRGGASAAT